MFTAVVSSLLVCVAQASPMGKAMFDKLFSRALKASPLHDLDDTTLSKLTSSVYPLASSRLPSASSSKGQHRLVPSIVAHGTSEETRAKELATKKLDAAPLLGYRPDRSPVATQAFFQNFGGGRGQRVALPRDYGDVTIQSQRAIQAALKDGVKLLEVEFPPIGLQGVAGDGEGGVEMDSVAYHMSSIVRNIGDSKSRLLFPDDKDLRRMTTRGIALMDAGMAPNSDRSRDAPFAGTKFRKGYLTSPSGLNDFFISTDKRVSTRCEPDDSMYLVAYPSFNVNEMLSVGELYEDLGKENGVPIVIFNGELDRIRSGYYPSMFYPKLGTLNKEFMPQVEGVYYLKNFKGPRPGVLFRAYPGPWQVLQVNPLTEETRLLQEFDTRPTLQQAAKLIQGR